MELERLFHINFWWWAIFSDTWKHAKDIIVSNRKCRQKNLSLVDFDWHNFNLSSAPAARPPDVARSGYQISHSNWRKERKTDRNLLQYFLRFFNFENFSRTYWPKKTLIFQQFSVFENHILKSLIQPYWLYMLTSAELCFIIVTVCIFRYKFFIKEKRPKSRIILTWKWKRYHTWPREFSRNICSNDHETSIPRSLNTYSKPFYVTKSW